MPPTTLLVCDRCRAPGADPAAPRAGAALLGHARRLAADDPALRVAAVGCVSGCRRPCAAAVLAPGKAGYLFGDLPADAAGAADLVAVARLHAAAADGFLARAARPERLRAGILGRLPPLHWLPEGEFRVQWPS